jgi:aminopeptidase N
MKLSTLILSALTLGFSSCVSAQLMQPKGTFTRQDTLRGSIGPGRAWWDVQHYTVEVTPDYASKTITGRTTIRFKVLPGRKSNNMQIDLQQPLVIDSLFYDNRPYINDPGAPFYQQGNTWQVPLPRTEDGSVHTLTIAYHGRPKEAINPPWDGGWIWRKDKEGNPWMSVAVQGMGASAWYPCKDHQSDEPDQGSRLVMNIPSNLVGVGNGRLKSRESINGLTRFTWEVTSPINNYNIVPYIGKYTNWSDTLQGEKGTLSLNFWVLQQDTARARQSICLL